ncbi:hypothetical protein GDO86_012863 [Hymenochirus boettgeri]|uniref:Ig-like domain-containing protein n=1 Tax=Hymenochirus boettgeri TaxID=247094 RepID=A0A8T2IUF5_9PIPI|nr:hypothetical protein GDO86_012863 [Hymenochirus boettgeri]
MYHSSAGSQFILEWKFAPGNTAPSNGRQIYYYSNGKTYKPGSQAERLSIFNNPPTTGIASVQLNNIRSSDSGSYACEVNNPPDFSGTGSGIVKLIVQVPPSNPECQLSGSAIAGHEITLTCSSSEGNPTPVYTWSHEGSTITLFPGLMENQISGSLLITNLSQANSGTYKCVASNDQGSASCDLTVSISNKVDAGTIAGVVVGVLLAILLIVAVAIYILCYRRKQKKPQKPDYPGNELREDATSPVMPENNRASRTDSSLLNSTGRRHENMVV